MSQSEVARIRARIDAEVEALNRVFHGFAVVANHQSITQRTARIGDHMQQLQMLVGKEEGAKMVMESLEALEEEPHPCPNNSRDGAVQEHLATRVGEQEAVSMTVETYREGRE